MKAVVFCILLSLSISIRAASQTSLPEHHHSNVPHVPLQPLAQQVRQIAETLDYLGQPLSREDQVQINEAVADANESSAVARLQAVLEPRVLITVEINGESRVKVEAASARPELVQSGTRLFLVKVINHAGVTAELNVDSPNARAVYIVSKGLSKPPMDLSSQAIMDRWADISLYQKPPMQKRLSGLLVEYQILAVYSRDAGKRAAKISFNVGQGSQDIGFRNETAIVFAALPARPLILRVKDENGKPAMASFVIRDQLGRLYPNPLKRLAPDFFFQPQIYRADGEIVHLPEGHYTVTYGGGPEFLPHVKKFTIRGEEPPEVEFQLDRWIDPSKFGWYSGDHHIHAAGCAHYQNPTEGVLPGDMIRQILGERLNIGSVLTWGPDYYYQKQFFSGHDDPLSVPNKLMHYDLEVSGFPSSHAGHLVLLGLNEQEYHGTKQIEDWPTWDLPILQWAKSQGAVAGFAHSGWGLQVSSTQLPNYSMPGFDGIGANEYIVDVTHPNSVDFISAVDTPYIWELNIWYHTLNVGFRARIAGETDFPCIFDDRVGIGRSYAEITGPLSYRAWLDALKSGRSYVSDGKTHLMKLIVGGVGVGQENSEKRLQTPATVEVTIEAAAYLPELPNADIRKLPYDQKPFWDIERARIEDTRQVPVEIVVNGKAVASQNLYADGVPRELKFRIPIQKSSWVAARVLPAAHTNPVFVIVDGKPIRASRRSAKWCLDSVNQCWTQKSPRIALAEIGEAREAYDHARQVYQELISECTDE